MSGIVLEEVHLESSTYCDAACVFCPQKSVKRKGEMSYDLMMKVVDEAVDLGCGVFTPFRANEPLQFHRLIGWLLYFRRKKVKAIIFTNANNLTDEMGAELIQFSDVIHSVTISFHGGTPEVYNANMGLDFQKVSENVKAFVAKVPLFPVHIFCMRRSTVAGSEEDFLRFWQPVAGFTSVTIRGTMEWAGDCPDEMAPLRELDAVNRVPCSRILRQLDVAYNGDVALCCVDAHNQVLFGNLQAQTIQETWDNRMRQWYMEQHNACNFDIPLCKECSINIG
jgi:radical SAM protein with 4Fe4S-binding SPASM domain